MSNLSTDHIKFSQMDVRLFQKFYSYYQKIKTQREREILTRDKYYVKYTTKCKNAKQRVNSFYEEQC